jgi:5'-nucleotidase
MDAVLVDLDAGLARLDAEISQPYQGRLDEVPGIFSLVEPLPHAIESFLKS